MIIPIIIVVIVIVIVIVLVLVIVIIDEVQYYHVQLTVRRVRFP